MKRKIVFVVFALLAARGVAMTFESGPIKVVADDIAADLVVTNEFGQKFKFTARFDDDEAIVYLTGKGGGS